jgi:DnaK suppressor protein
MPRAKQALDEVKATGRDEHRETSQGPAPSPLRGASDGARPGASDGVGAKAPAAAKPKGEKQAAQVRLAGAKAPVLAPKNRDKAGRAGTAKPEPQGTAERPSRGDAAVGRPARAKPATAPKAPPAAGASRGAKVAEKSPKATTANRGVSRSLTKVPAVELPAAEPPAAPEAAPSEQVEDKLAAGEQKAEHGEQKAAAQAVAKGRATRHGTAKKQTSLEAVPLEAGDAGQLSRDQFLLRQRELLLMERNNYTRQAEELRAQAEALALEHEPGDVQFDEEGGEGGTVNIDREIDLQLSAQARAAIEEIDAALAKIDAGTYGLCESCGTLIPEARLEALPQARLCVRCKSGGLAARRH